MIHPPVTKPSEPPAGIARLAGALCNIGVDCTLIDANIQGLIYLLSRIKPGEDTWSQRAHRHLDTHLALLRSSKGYQNPDAYRRAVADIGRLLSLAQGGHAGIRLGLANYTDGLLTPLCRADLLQAARKPDRNPYFDFFRRCLLPIINDKKPYLVGISINYLSQALCAFSLIGLVKKTFPGLKIIIGGGLVTSWLQPPGRSPRFDGLVDEMVSGPGESALLRTLDRTATVRNILPDYSGLRGSEYLSPGFVLPYSAATGCWWRRCVFCPEQAEKHPYRPLPHAVAVDHLRQLTVTSRPSLIHLLDNALSPAFLKALVSVPPGAPWYGFVRIGSPLDDPEFCKELAKSGCVMLKIGLESGDQRVLDALEKGVHLTTAHRVLKNLKQAGIAAYVYLLFGTPAEDEAAARRTLRFVVDHREAIDFLNAAVFNLPLNSPQVGDLEHRDFYPGDLALYRDFEHPKGWSRAVVRRFLEKKFKKHPAVQPIVRRDPPVFTSNHAPFFTDSHRAWTGPEAR